jgi:hypothetical protein
MPNDAPLHTHAQPCAVVQNVNEERALTEGLPHPTLIASLLPKYAAGRLKEV